ncbi:MAG: site-2 protease family protein [Actinobacteria bacterium]|nr:site-2 protease family protein [Actinomycetota bacterium]
MTFVTGVVLFAVGLAVSIAAHEFGHLLTAKAFGMNARRYFLGFGRTLWSFRKGETEYGVKAIPLGGFVEIAGMSHAEELPADDEPRAFWRFATWKRVVVMSAGSVTHIGLALVILYGVAITAGLPNTDPTIAPVIGRVADCIQTVDPNGTVHQCTATDPASPARLAGLAAGDRIVAVGGEPTATWDRVVLAIRTHPGSALRVDYVRDGVTRGTVVNIGRANRPALPGEPHDASGMASVGVLATEAKLPPATIGYGPIAGVGATGGFTLDLMGRTVDALGQFPAKVPALFEALSGKPRDPNSPISVVGASKLGGQALEAGSVLTFFLLLASINIFIGIFNMLPLLPLDGGHIAVLLFERARSGVARLLGRQDPGRIDPATLAPVMVAFVVLVGGISVLTILADLVNPIANPFQ